ncbi:type IV toxin-antitoxin system AbiEi family antitoxin domain-containing protein [Kribbella sp. NPDC023972]|uniref:type IV toxin-antitoxin system AbiEi family antitoxin domain-containing protein n=1 Tax=Kribbella sp. NPDC023972 TaxID=3154795 RepID=UPI0033DD7159
MKEVAAELPSTFTTGAARALGVHPRDLYSWRDTGQVIELSRGVFRRADAPVPSFPDFLAVAYRSPTAIVCCASAAAAHELTDELPVAVQIAVPGRARAPRVDYPPTTVYRFDERTFEIGLSRLEAAPGEWVRIYDAPRTVVDLMRLRRRLGEPLAHTALQRYVKQRGAKPALLLEYASALGVHGPMRTALDIASAG